jgi:GTP-binding protein
VILVDLASVDGRSPSEQERILVEELRRYQPEMVTRPRVVVGSRVDLAGEDVEWAGERLSAVSGEGLRPLLGRMATIVEEARAAQPAPGRFVVHRPVPAGVQVSRDSSGSGWVVLGRAAERAVALSDLTIPEALAHAQGRLRSLGVDRALARAGARSGDVVRVGGFEFEYEPDSG